MKRYNGMPWDEFIALIGDAVKEEIERQAPIARTYGLASLQTAYGKFGSLESNYTLKEGKGLAGKLIGIKIFTIHDNSAEGITPRVILHDSTYFGQKAEEIFRLLGMEWGMDFKVEYG